MCCTRLRHIMFSCNIVANLTPLASCLISQWFVPHLSYCSTTFPSSLLHISFPEIAHLGSFTTIAIGEEIQFYQLCLVSRRKIRSSFPPAEFLSSILPSNSCPCKYLEECPLHSWAHWVGPFRPPHLHIALMKNRRPLSQFTRSLAPKTSTSS